MIKTTGNVHTASYYTPQDLKPCSATQDVFTVFRPSNKHGTLGTHFKFNPNHFVSDCMSLKEYESILFQCFEASQAAQTRELTRIDFKTDCIGEPIELKRWSKLGEYAVKCFIAKKNVQKRNDSETRTGTRTSERQSVRGETDGFTVTCYNKALQKVSEGVGYRFEVSWHQQDTRTEREALTKLKELVLSLPTATAKAEAWTNESLIDMLKRTDPCTGERRSITEVLRCNENRLFSFRQIKSFYEALGKTPTQAAEAAKNFRKRNRQIDFFTQSDIDNFCQEVAQHIDTYLG